MDTKTEEALEYLEWKLKDLYNASYFDPEDAPDKMKNMFIKIAKERLDECLDIIIQIRKEYE